SKRDWSSDVCSSDLARSLAAGTWGEDDPGVSHGAVSEDPHELGDLTALTYQMLSVVGADNPFEELARRRWIDELVDGGRTAADRSEERRVGKEGRAL